MANVLNEFLSGVSKGFADAAFASFSRRRSTVREDINQTFGGTPEEGDVKAKPASAGAAYLDLLNSDDTAVSVADTKAIAAPKSAVRKTGVVDAKKGGAKPAKKPARPSGGGSLKEI
jgi:hypothetical protein